MDMDPFTVPPKVAVIRSILIRLLPHTHGELVGATLDRGDPIGVEKCNDSFGENNVLRKQIQELFKKCNVSPAVSPQDEQYLQSGTALQVSDNQVNQLGCLFRN